MAYAISFYNFQTVKTKLPSPLVSIPIGFVPVVNRDYIVKRVIDNGKPYESIFELKTLRFSVKNIIFRDYSKNFAIFSASILEYQDGNEIPPAETISMSGYFYNLYKDAVYECEGYWIESKTGRQQFVITAYTQLKTGSLSVVECYLKNILAGLKVSKSAIHRIVGLFGFEALEKIKKDDVGLDKIIKDEGKRKAVVQRVIDQEEKEKALQFLVQWGLSIDTTMAVIDTFGAATYSMIRKNPNVLFRFPSISSKLIDRMAISEHKTFNDPIRVEGYVRRYLLDREKLKGDIYIDYAEFIPDPTNMLCCGSEFAMYVFSHGAYKDLLSCMLIDTALTNLVEHEKIAIEDSVSVPGRKYVYRQYYNFAENRVVEKIKTLLNDVCTSFIDDATINSEISKIESRGFAMDKKQKDAVKMALQNKLSILSGGPGTGKTQTTKTVVELFSSIYPGKKIKLCAPTGKASRRMSEVINLPAATIHKTLNYVPFSNIEMNEIDADFLIIDEVSMMDIDLFCKVLSNIQDNTSVLLVGDYNQLPSVGPGLILRDLIDSNTVPFTILTKVFRQGAGSKIVSAAYDILNDKPENIEKRSVSDFIFYNTNSSEETYKIMRRYLKKMIASGISPEEIQIITPANDGKLGVMGLNAMARELINPYGALKGEIVISPTRTFAVGDRVIQTKNNYDLFVFNGAIGTIKYIDPVKDTAVIDFDGVDVDYSHKDLLDLKLGYAITVHKSQGSEFNYVLMPIVGEHLFVSNRNLLYTAVTRARTKFVLVGETIALEETCHKIEHFSRKSQIKEKLNLGTMTP